MSTPPDEPMTPPADEKGPRPAAARPWYLVATMCVMWLMGVAGMLSGCEEVDYLRGSSDITRQLARDADEATHPLTRTVVVRQQAWVEALGHHHRTAFPISAMRMLVAVVLVVGSGGALVGQRAARKLALQAIAANAAVAVVAFVLLAPVRHETAHAVAVDAVDNAVGVPQGQTRDHVVAEQHELAMQREQSMVVFYLGLLAVAAFALTRKRTKDYFASLTESVPDAGS